MTRPAVHRTDVDLRPDGVRVVGRPHVPGDDERMSGIVGRILRLTQDEVEAELEDVHRRFAGRHRDLALLLSRNAERVAHLLPRDDEPRRSLVGAYLTQEHAFQAAALTNPSMVVAPDQSGLPDGSCRFVLSLRAIAEGHLSSIAFRTGVVDAAGSVHIEPAGPLAETGERRAAVYERRHFAEKLVELGADPGLTTRVMDRLPRHFGPAELEQAIAVLDEVPAALSRETTKVMRWLASSNYLLAFDPTTT